MKKEVKKNNYLAGIIVLIAVVAIIGVVGVVGAFSGSAQQVFENANVTINNGIGGNLGAAQSDIASGFWDLYVENDLKIDGNLLSAATFEATLDFTTATGTGAVALPNTQALLGSVQNDSGEALLCTYAIADITATGIYGVEITGGVATTATSSASVIATEYVATSTDELVQQATPGTAFDFAASSYFTVTRTTDAVNATSSDSFTTHGNNAGTGTLHVDCILK